MTAVEARIAAAPISWGVCEVPGWGYQLRPQRVLGEMRDLGIRATEFGPAGFLPDRADEAKRLLSEYGLSALGGFLPVLLHERSYDVAPEVDRFIDTCLAAGAGVVVLAAFTGTEGYDARPRLDDAGWAVLLSNLDRIKARAEQRGVTAALHPHVGTMVESREEVARVLTGSGIGLCVDTGHLLVGGTDPVALVRDELERVAHVHLKDVRVTMAEQVRAGTLTYGEAVRRGLYAPLGDGDVDVAALVQILEKGGYEGWYVLEQDVMLDREPVGEGPLADVRASLQHLREVAP